MIINDIYIYIFKLTKRFVSVFLRKLRMIKRNISFNHHHLRSSTLFETSAAIYVSVMTNMRGISNKALGDTSAC